MFGGTATGESGVFGAQTSSPFSSSSTFGASSSPAIVSSPSFGGSSVLGHKPAFGGFGSITRTSPFGGTSQQSQPAFGSSFFGSNTPFGVTSHSAFGAASSPAFGSTSTTPAFCATSAPTFCATSAPTFCATSAPTFSASSTPAFGASSNPSFSFGSSPAFGQSTSAFGSTPFGSSTFGPQSFQFGAQAARQRFGNTGFGQLTFSVRCAGSRTVPYSATPDTEIATNERLKSISAMPNHKDRSHEELRWEDYQVGDKGSSVFGQKLAFGGFGSTTETSPFGGIAQQSQPAFGRSLFSSTAPFGATSQSAFVAASTPAFGSTSIPAFGATIAPSFSAASTPSYGATITPAFGAISMPVFGASSTPAFGATSTPAFGATSSPVFSATSTPALGSTSTPTFVTTGSAFGVSNSPFGAASSPAFGASSTPAFGASSMPLYGAQATTQTFGNPGFGQSPFSGQRVGSRAVPYSATPDTESGGVATNAKLESISAMPIYKDKSHEELRWEDYQAGDKGGPFHCAGGTGIGVSVAQPSMFGTSSSFSQPFSNLFSTTTFNPFCQKTSTFGLTTPTFNTPFAPTSSSAFPSTSMSQSIFGTSSSSPSLFNSATQGSTSPFNIGINVASTQSNSLFQSTMTSLGQTGFAQNTQSLGILNTPNTGFGLIISSTPSLTPTDLGPFGQTSVTFNISLSMCMPFQQSQPSQTTSAFSFNNLRRTQAGGTNGFAGVSGTFDQNNYRQPLQPAPGTNPFGTLPTMPQMSIGGIGTTPSVQYGISIIPVVDKPASGSSSSVLTSRHLSRRLTRKPARKW